MDFQQIKNKITAYDMEIARNSGILHSIQSEWMKNYNTVDIEEIKKILHDKNEQLTKIRNEIETLSSTAQEIINELDAKV